jgi:hypothetical protein
MNASAEKLTVEIEDIKTQSIKKWKRSLSELTHSISDGSVQENRSFELASLRQNN